MTNDTAVAGIECSVPEAIIRRLKRCPRGASRLRALPAFCLTGVTAVTGLRWLALPVCWPTDLLCSFPLQYGLAAILICGTLAFLGRPFGAALSLAVAAVNFSMLAPATRFADRPASGASLQIYSANVLCTNRWLNRLVGDISTREPDLVFLTEVSPRHLPALDALLEAYPYTVMQAGTGYTGFAFLSKWPVRRKRVVCRDDHGSRPVLNAEVDVNGETFHVYGIHPHAPVTPLKFQTRERQFSWLAGRVREVSEPTVVMGDFNTTPYSPSFRRLLSASGLKDTRLDHGWVPSWPAFLPFLWVPIDHILVNDRATVQSIERGPFIGSDHYPLIARIAFRG